jgi:hypothetical protein
MDNNYHYEFQIPIYIKTPTFSTSSSTPEKNDNSPTFKLKDDDNEIESSDTSNDPAIDIEILDKITLKYQLTNEDVFILLTL